MPHDGRAGPVPDPRERIADLAASAREDPDIDLLYLTGGFGRGHPTPLSDIDLAVLLSPSCADRFRKRLDLHATWSLLLRTDAIDIIVLNDASIALAFAAIRDGRIIFCRDEVVRVRFESGVFSRYQDMEHWRRIQREGLRRRIREGRFGRP